MKPLHTLSPYLLAALLLACGAPDAAPPEDVPAPGKTAADTTAHEPVAEGNEDGIHEMRDANGVLIMRGEKIGGLRQGGWESYFPDGTLRSKATFIDGKQEGPSIVFHENGAIFYTGWYRKGIPVQDWTFYDPDGTPVKLVRYGSSGQVLEERPLN
jgi:hypothetical protein